MLTTRTLTRRSFVSAATGVAVAVPPWSRDTPGVVPGRRPFRVCRHLQVHRPWTRLRGRSTFLRQRSRHPHLQGRSRDRRAVGCRRRRALHEPQCPRVRRDGHARLFDQRHRPRRQRHLGHLHRVRRGSDHGTVAADEQRRLRRDRTDIRECASRRPPPPDRQLRWRLRGRPPHPPGRSARARDRRQEQRPASSVRNAPRMPLRAVSPSAVTTCRTRT